MSRASLAVPDQISATFDWLSYNPLSYLSRTTFHQLIGDWMDGTLAASMTTLTEGLIQRTLRSENYALPCLSEKQQQVDDWEAGFVKETGERRSGGLSDDINIRRKSSSARPTILTHSPTQHHTLPTSSKRLQRWQR